MLVSSGICALCKILRPAYTRLRREAALAKVSVLHMDLDTQKVRMGNLHVSDGIG